MGSSVPPAAAIRGSDRILERMKALHPKIIDLSLDRVWRLLDALDHPERALPPVVHVAGTNGKGSVIAYMRAMLEAAGYRVHGYISPHLVRFHERIRLAGRLIAEPALEAVLAQCELANGDTPITYFEITTCAALLAFARTPADVLLLETGLGGRLDATNVVEQPALTIITPVSYDHHQYLGDSLAAIAGEKAGILKPGVTAVVGTQPPEALAVIEARARAVGAPLLRAGREWAIKEREDGMTFTGPRGALALPRPSLVGPHQAENAGIAVAGIGALSGFAVSQEAMGRGLRNADWPGRLQRLGPGALTALLPGSWELWLDGGHNAAAGLALAAQAALWARDGKPLHLVFGMLETKSPTDFLRPLAPYAGVLRAVAVPGEPASLPAGDAARAADEAGFDAAPAASIAAALADIAASATGPARILVCGSLYLAGSVLRENGA